MATVAKNSEATVAEPTSLETERDAIGLPPMMKPGLSEPAAGHTVELEKTKLGPEAGLMMVAPPPGCTPIRSTA
ncbi:MAG: hypothetical protein KKG69_05255 [Alphaproteobacteria bacterium]|nr:hypothetical protein [Alphaproteobacteria bacterium]